MLSSVERVHFLSRDTKVRSSHICHTLFVAVVLQRIGLVLFADGVQVYRFVHLVNIEQLEPGLGADPTHMDCSAGRLAGQILLVVLLLPDFPGFG